MNEQLRALYERHLPDLLDLLNRHPNTSYPHLIQVSDGYLRTRPRVVFVGQRPRAWEPKNGEAKEMEADLPNRLIDGLLKLYTTTFPGEVPKHSPFWQAVRRVYKALVPDGPEDGYVWANLVKVDGENRRPPQDVEQDWFERFNVLAEEISILKPDVVIFFTGPDYDNRLFDSFPDAELFRVAGADQKDIARVEHPDLPALTYRTRHPTDLNYNRKRSQILDQLIALCKQ